MAPRPAEATRAAARALVARAELAAILATIVEDHRTARARANPHYAKPTDAGHPPHTPATPPRKVTSTRPQETGSNTAGRSHVHLPAPSSHPREASPPHRAGRPSRRVRKATWQRRPDVRDRKSTRQN